MYLHYTTLHYTTLHYTTLHYTTLHYTTVVVDLIIGKFRVDYNKLNTFSIHIFWCVFFSP